MRIWIAVNGLVSVAASQAPSADQLSRAAGAASICLRSLVRAFKRKMPSHVEYASGRLRGAEGTDVGTWVGAGAAGGEAAGARRTGTEVDVASGTNGGGAVAVADSAGAEFSHEASSHAISRHSQPQAVFRENNIASVLAGAQIRRRPMC